MPAADHAELKPPVYVETNRTLEKLCQRLSTQQAIAVDTEANPLFAYREKLCLIQISTRRRDYIVDPLADLDLELLVPIFADPNVVKVFHDAEFDVLMLKRTMPMELCGLFDTKVVATSLGLDTVGLAPILAEFFGVTLDKKFQRSDWGRRPLSDGQLDYARYDTHFLLRLADDLRDRLLAKDPIHQLEVAAEFRRVEGLAPDHKCFNPDDFTKIKGWEKLDPARRRVLRELFVMRHERADALDRPAFKVLSNDLLYRLAEVRPEDEQALRKSKVLSAKLRERYGGEVLQAVQRGMRLSPLPDDKVQRSKKDVDELGEEQRQTFEDLRTWRKKAATSRGADASLVLPKASMFALSRLRSAPKNLEELQNTGVLEPWRLEYYGEGILAALQAASRGGVRPRRSGRGRGRRAGS